MTELFDHELKFRRAFDHLMEIDRLVKPWVKGEHHSVRHEVNPNDGTWTFFATAEQPAKNPLSLLIGEFLHSIRSGLDNLAFALANAFTKPLPDEWTPESEFPIFGDRDKSGATGIGKDKFHQVKKDGTPANGSGLAKIRGWSPKAQTIVEGLQPYHRGTGFDTHPLWILHELDRVNKHRLMHLGIVWSKGFAWNVGRSINAASMDAGVIHAYAVWVETNTPIAQTPAFNPVDPKREVKVEINPALFVAFGPGVRGVMNKPVYEVLLDIYSYVRLDIIPKLGPFL